MAGQEQTLVINEVVFVEALTPESIVAKAHGLALLMGVNLPKPRIETEADLDRGLQNIQTRSSHTMTEFFCGAQKNDSGELVPMVWVEQGYLVSGGKKLIFQVGVETGLYGQGITKYWFIVKSGETDIPEEAKVLVENFNWIGKLMTGFLSRELLFYTPRSERTIWRTILAADLSDWHFNDPRKCVTNTDY